MKKFKKLFGIFVPLLFVLAGLNLISCSDSDENETEYSISIADSDKEITLAPGSSKTIDVTTNGAMLKPASTDEKIATATLDNSKKTITITAASGITETKTAEITVKLSEDSSKSVTIKVNVNPEATENPNTNEEKTYSLALDLDETVAKEASKIEVCYGADSGTYETVEAVYTIGEASATAALKLSLANSYGWFNKIKVTVYDSDRNIVATEIDSDNFDSSKTGATIKITAYVEQTMTLKFTFSENLGAKSVKIHYYSADIEDDDLTDSVGKTESADVAENAASFTLSKSYASTWGFNALVNVYDSNGDDITSNSDNVTFSGTGAGSENATISDTTVKKIWFAFAADSEETVSFTKEDENQTYDFPYTSNTIAVSAGNTYTRILPAQAFKSLTVKQLTVKITSETENAWASLSGASAYSETTYIQNAISTEKTITDETFINAVLENGLYMETSAGNFVVTVNYSSEAEEAVTYTQLGDEISVTDASSIKQIVEASKFQDANPSKVKIELSDINGADESSIWITLATDSNWSNKIENMQATKTVVLDYDSNALFIAGLLSNGLYIGTASGVTCTVKVFYIAGESKTPGSFTVTAGTSTTETIPLTWTASENAQYYTVKYKASAETDYTEAGTVTETSYTILRLADSTTYTILVTAYNGKNGTDAGAVEATTAEITGSGSINAKLLSSETLTITTGGTYQLAVTYDSIKDYDTVYITLASITEWGSGADYTPMLGTDTSTWKANFSWVESENFTDSNVSSTTGGYFAEIKPSDYSNGVYITGKTGLAGTLYVTGLSSTSE